ncbi:MAG: Hsp20/alpha crystallin family protein [Bryobacteraceae bacterium]|nr:Hsp20/alpha crystallin family protein [Bryobacteraceae bacterium]
MTLTRYNPFRSFEESGLQLFQDTLNRFFSEPATARPWTPHVDVLETENEIVVKADVPGIDEKDIDIKIENGALTLKGERKFEKEDREKGYHRIERGYGSFVRCFSLPESVDAEKVNAGYKAGVLTVTLPKREAAKPRSIKVSVN